MAMRDYNRDGKTDRYDDMIEQDLFYGDDNDLEDHFRSLHNTLHSRRGKSYTAGSNYVSPPKDAYKEFKYRHNIVIDIIAGIGFMIVPPFGLAALCMDGYGLIVAFAAAVIFSDRLLRFISEGEDIKVKKEYNYVDYLRNHFPEEEAKKKIAAFRAYEDKNQRDAILFLVLLVLSAVISIPLLMQMS